MKESNKTYAVNVLNYIRESKSIDNDLLEEGVARLFSNDNQSFEDNLEKILNWLYTGGNERTNVHTLVAELGGNIKTSTVVGKTGEVGYRVTYTDADSNFVSSPTFSTPIYRPNYR